MTYSFRSCAIILDDGDDEPVSWLSAMHEAATPNVWLFINKNFKSYHQYHLPFPPSAVENSNLLPFSKKLPPPPPKKHPPVSLSLIKSIKKGEQFRVTSTRFFQNLSWDMHIVLALKTCTVKMTKKMQMKTTHKTLYGKRKRSIFTVILNILWWSTFLFP